MLRGAELTFHESKKVLIAGRGVLVNPLPGIYRIFEGTIWQEYNYLGGHYGYP
jgi:hypothetical protein